MRRADAAAPVRGLEYFLHQMVAAVVMTGGKQFRHHLRCGALQERTDCVAAQLASHPFKLGNECFQS